MAHWGLGLLLVVCCFAQSYAVSRCNDELIKDIKNFWIGTGVPNHILSTLKDSGLLGLTHSSNTFSLKNLKTSEAKCVYGDFTSTKATFTVLPQKGKKKSASFIERESDGVLYEEGDDIERYIIFSKNGVTPFYICSRKSGNRKGAPAGGISVAVSKYDDPETRSTINVAIGVLRNLNIKLNQSFNKQCFKNK